MFLITRTTRLVIMAGLERDAESHVLDECTTVKEGGGSDGFVEIQKTDTPISIR